MPLTRANDYSVAIDPRTGELRSAAKTFSGPGGLRGTGGFNWRPLAIACGVVLALAAGVFLVAIVSELM